MTTTTTPITGHPDYELITSEPTYVRNIRHHGAIVGRVRHYSGPLYYWEAELGNALSGRCGRYETPEQAAVAVATAHQEGLDEFRRRHMWAEDVAFRSHLPGWVPQPSPAEYDAAVARQDAARATGSHPTA